MFFTIVRMVGFEPTISCSRSTRPEKTTPCQTFPHPDKRKASSENRTRNSSLARRWVTTTPWTPFVGSTKLSKIKSTATNEYVGARNRTHAAALRKRCHSTRPSVLIHSVGSVGIEPTSAGLRVRCITLSATIPFLFVCPSRRGRTRTFDLRLIRTLLRPSSCTPNK